MSTWHDWLHAVGDVATVLYMVATTATIRYLGKRLQRAFELLHRLSELHHEHLKGHVAVAKANLDLAREVHRQVEALQTPWFARTPTRRHDA